MLRIYKMLNWAVLILLAYEFFGAVILEYKAAQSGECGCCSGGGLSVSQEKVITTLAVLTLVPVLALIAPANSKKFSAMVAGFGLFSIFAIYMLGCA